MSGSTGRLETKDLVLDKAKSSDWEDMYENVWSRPESAKYMFWRVTKSEEDARIRIAKTIAFQKSHDTWLVYEKKSKKAIGFAGIEELAPGIYQEAGICLGPDYLHRGFGRQIVQCLLKYCRELGAKEFFYSCREENEASNGLARSMGFERVGTEPREDERDGHRYRLVRYRRKL